MSNPECAPTQTPDDLDYEALRAKYPGLITAAYGNAGSDLDHLKLADQPLLVNGSTSACEQAQRLGVPCARWS